MKKREANTDRGIANGKCGKSRKAGTRVVEKNSMRLSAVPLEFPSRGILKSDTPETKREAFFRVETWRQDVT